MINENKGNLSKACVRVLFSLMFLLQTNVFYRRDKCDEGTNATLCNYPGQLIKKQIHHFIPPENS